MSKVLVVDDDPSIFLLIRKALADVAQMVTAETAAAGLRELGQDNFDCVLLDIMLPDRDGLSVYGEIRDHDPRLPVIFMTSEASSETAIEAMQLGAFDYLAKPLEIRTLCHLVENAIEQRERSSVPVEIVASDEADCTRGELFIGRSRVMLDVFKDVGRVSKQDLPVLVRGERGTGKELVARALVQHSDRSAGPFLAVNCAVLTDSLLESELFGHEKGAFPGAESRRVGKLEQCHGGTLFLDEIGAMSPVVQGKLLRFLQEQRFERLGGNEELTSQVRIVAATHRALEPMVADDDFREDLLYRLNTVTIDLPPLRERSDDIPLLIAYFLNQAKREFDKPDLRGVSPEAVDLLKAYDWPGNVRQLRSVVRRCVLDASLPVIVADVLPEDIRRGESSPEILGLAPEDRDGPSGRAMPSLVDRLLREKSSNMYGETIAYAEKYLLLRVLRETDGNQSRAAEMLGITRGKLRDRIATYNIQLSDGVRLGNPR
ncbi:MAG: sigma-54 dependent transcriptional regulator [Planctomycetota bacterium]